ncbi:hypothetical protein BBK82_37475 [Lentzea guizhouensis]|uniref:Major facilitator superfamily (MFS) profile domain-containing protein n=1 Tax=Lentzea guizhouensis TaxID=1586287 RepID=A0A1B2HT00_9PSEU|nr:hypothetical protein BBK82_37475 [Lentzea guizhouensis]
MHLAAAAITVLGIGFAVQAYAPDVATYVVVGMLTQAMTYAGIITLSLVVAAVTPPGIRATAFAIVGVAVALVGGLGGAFVTAVAEAAWGVRPAIAVVAPLTCVVAGLVLLTCTRHLRRDITTNGDLR